jgi:glycosyltransferase involved in cell wall biosynthesis
MALADLVLTCSSRDAEEIRAQGARRVEVVPNGVNLGEATGVPSKRCEVVFVGSLDYWPNAEAATRLAKEIWPLARGRLPSARLTIVGRRPPRALRALAGKEIGITGTVPSVRPFLDRAFATAIPLRAGSGTRLKILEAAAARVPIVCSALASEGLPLTHGRHALFAETAEEFAHALARLWLDRALADRLAAEAYAVAEAHDWTRIRADLVSLYRSLPASCRGKGPSRAQA